jgi:GT2 family glycosyltransferase
MKPRVTAIIVNWNGERDTVVCLNSLKTVEYDNLQVILSDNGSRAESVCALEDWFIANPPSPKSARGITDYQLIENGRNLGFTGANSVGIEAALRHGAEYVLFLNNDTIVTPDFLERMVDVAEEDGSIGIVGCKIFFAEPDAGEDSPRIWSLGGYRFRFGMPLNVAHGERDRPEWTGVHRQDLINGCCMLIRRRVIEQIGVQDDLLFFGMDDVEYSLRAARQGWTNAVVRDAFIYHAASRSVNSRSALQAYYLFRNVLYFRLRNFSWRENVGFGLVFAFRYLAAGAAVRWLVGRGAVNRGMVLGLRDCMAGRMGECPHPALRRDRA